MPIGFKHRQWEAFVSVSASGPEFSKIFERNGYLLRTRMAADLDYTTADVDYFYEHFRVPEPDRPRTQDKHIRLVNPTRTEVLNGLSHAIGWLATFRDHEDWDGGALHFNYAGHGAEQDGALVLGKDVLSVEEFLKHIAPLAEKVSPPGRLRLSVVLDSCHSGYWVARILASCFHEFSEHLVPFNLFASCMHDEAAFEDSSLGHGLFTYCFSVRPNAIGAFGAQAILSNNQMGPSLSIATGERGCSLLSAGAQNPVAYCNGAGELEVAQSSFPIESSSGDFMQYSELVATLTRHREAVRNSSAGARPEIRVDYDADEERARQAVRALRRRLEESESAR
jgi:hypothetical protein